MDFDTALAEAGELGLWQWAVSRKERSKKKTRSWRKKHPNNKIHNWQPSSRCCCCSCRRLSFRECGASYLYLLVMSLNTGEHSDMLIVVLRKAQKWTPLFQNQKSCFSWSTFALGHWPMILFRCKVDICDDKEEPGFDQPWLNFTLPPGNFFSDL